MATVPTSDRAAPLPAAPPELPPLRLSAALLVIALMPFPLVVRGWGNPKLAYDYLTIVFPVDIAFAALLVTGARPFAERLRSRRAGMGTTVWAALAAVMSLAWLAHPSSRGFHTVFELWAVAVLADTVAETVERGAGMFISAVFGGIAVVETLWSAAQLVTGGSLGLTALGEDAHPLLRFSHQTQAPMGSMVHPYVLAGLALVGSGLLVWQGLSSRRPAVWFAGAAVAIAPVGFTFSRAGALGALLLVGGIALAGRRLACRRLVAGAVLALALGVAVPAAVWAPGWHLRAENTTSASSASSLTTDRATLVHQSVSLLRREPITGVGPGRYVPALTTADHLRLGSLVKPVHNLPLLIGAEGGSVALVLALLLFAAVGWRALRAGAVATAIYLAYIPFSMLDHFPYSFPQGLVITAVWLGVLDALSARRGRAREKPVLLAAER
jgi:hypothetical protein